jgi:hypothetical protein
MRRVGLLLITLAGPVFHPSAGTAQVSSADTAAVLLEAARRFEEQGDRRVADALLALIARAYPGTPASATAAERLAALRGADRAESGRVELIVWGTIYGTWLGIAVPAMLEADEPTPYGAGLLLGAPLGFATGKAYGRSTAMSQGQARVIRWGSIWGTWQGAGWREVLDLGIRHEISCDPFDPGNCYTYETESDVAPITAAVLGGLAGTLSAAAIARSRDVSTATSTMVEFGSLWGLWFSSATAAILEVDGEDAALSWLLLGGNAGLLAGALAGPRLGWSAGRVRLVSVTGLAGLVAGLGLDLLFEVDDDQAAFAIPLATSLAGLVAGAEWTRHHDARRQDFGERASAGALLEMRRGGRVGFAIPLPTPTVIPAGYDGRRMRREPGLRLRLFEASFSTER